MGKKKSAKKKAKQAKKVIKKAAKKVSSAVSIDEEDNYSLAPTKRAMGLPSDELAKLEDELMMELIVSLEALFMDIRGKKVSKVKISKLHECVALCHKVRSLRPVITFRDQD